MSKRTSKYNTSVAQEAATQQAVETTMPVEPSVVLETPSAETPPAETPEGVVVEEAPVVLQEVVKPQAQDLLTRHVKSETVLERDATTNYADKISKLSTSAQFPFATLLNYICDADLRKPNTDTTMGNLQKRLFGAYRGILENNPKEFPTTFGLLVAIVRENRKGVFSDLAIGRATYNFNGSSQERQAFESITNLLLVLADDPSMKTIKKQVNLDATFDVEYATGVDLVGIKNRVKNWIG